MEQNLKSVHPWLRDVSMLDNIIIEIVHSLADQHHVFVKRLPILLRRREHSDHEPPIRLIVIDSIAALFRVKEGMTFPQRAERLREITAYLQELSDTYGVRLERIELILRMKKLMVMVMAMMLWCMQSCCHQ